MVVVFQEDEMSRKFEMEAKEYISNNHNRREEMMDGLMKRE